MLRISLDKSSTFTVYFNRLLGRMVHDLEERGLIHHQVLQGENELLPRNPEL